MLSNTFNGFTSDEALKAGVQTTAIYNSSSSNIRLENL